MQEHRVARREWSWATGPYNRRIRLFQEPGEFGGKIGLEVRDWRQPGEYRYRSLSLGHSDREKAMKYASVLVRWWRATGKPPVLSWRTGRRGPKVTPA